jgi:hypothetical protein
MTSIIKSRSVSAPSAFASRVAGHAPEPRAACARPGRRGVKPILVGERVQALEITCACGEVTVVELEYAATAGADSTPASPASIGQPIPDPKKESA